MREIKFRVWDKVENKYHYNGILDNGDILVIYIDGRIGLSDNDTYKPEDFIFEQYTGLKDKNGKEIYEGDQLSFKNGNMSEPEIIGYLIYDDLRCCYSVSSEIRKDFYGLPLHQECDEGICEPKNLEIIENIHEVSI